MKFHANIGSSIYFLVHSQPQFHAICLLLKKTNKALICKYLSVVNLLGDSFSYRIVGKQDRYGDLLMQNSLSNNAKILR